MKKILEYLGITILFGISLIYTENITLNLDGISADSSINHLEIYKGVIRVGE